VPRFIFLGLLSGQYFFGFFDCRGQLHFQLFEWWILLTFQRLSSNDIARRRHGTPEKGNPERTYAGVYFARASFRCRFFASEGGAAGFLFRLHPPLPFRFKGIAPPGFLCFIVCCAASLRCQSRCFQAQTDNDDIQCFLSLETGQPLLWDYLFRPEIRYCFSLQWYIRNEPLSPFIASSTYCVTLHLASLQTG